MGRTLMQQALPTTFGLKAAGWLSRPGRAPGCGWPRWSPRCRSSTAGRSARWPRAAGPGWRCAPALAEELGLAVTAAPWHTVRLPIADLAGALGAAAGVVAGVAVDVVLLAQTEVAEAAEVSATRGGSSAMPHKDNPVAAISARACARRAPGLVGHAVRRDGAGARAGRRRLAQRVAHAHRPARHRRLRGVLAGREPRLAPRGHRPHGGDRRRGRGGRAGRGAGRGARTRPWAGARRTTPPPTPSSRPAETGRPLAEVLAGRPDLDLSALPTAPDVGEAGAQVDAVLADHRRLTEGTA